MKIKFHRKNQWDLDGSDEGRTVLACHMKSTTGRSTRLFAIVERKNGTYVAEFGGKWVREFFVEELDHLLARFS